MFDCSRNTQDPSMRKSVT